MCNQVALNKGLAPEKKLYCVYVLSGQSKAHNDKVISTLKMAGAMDFTTGTATARLLPRRAPQS